MTKAFETKYERNARRAGWLPAPGKAGAFCCGNDKNYREAIADSWRALCEQARIGIGKKHLSVQTIMDREGMA